MDWSGIPPLNSLRAFSVLTDTGSYTKAAAQLNVTHAAVRQQVKVLEDHLGMALVRRQGRGVRLTPEGVSLGRDLEGGFSAIQRAVETLTGAEASRPVQITTSPAFAVEWLLPRIPEFQQKNPDITLMINPTAELIELKPGGIDVAVRYRDKSRLEEEVEAVLLSDMAVLGAPSLVDGLNVDSYAALTGMPWLQELNTNEVAEWFKRREVTLDRPLMISQMPGNLIMQALRRGDGLSYTARAFFQDDIAAGRMRVLHSETATGVYCLEVNPGPVRPAVRKFLAWLRSKAEVVSEGGEEGSPYQHGPERKSRR